MRTILPAERRREIQRMVENEGAVGVGILAQELGVSEATIRNDLVRLEKMQVIERTHGGAVTPSFTKTQDTPLLTRKRLLSAEKEVIGNLAAKLVKNGETLAIDGSSTALYMVKCLPRNSQLTVITNSVQVLIELTSRPNISLIALGGSFKHSALSTLGSETEEAMQRYRVDRAYISPRGFDLSAGLTDVTIEDARMHRAMIASAQHLIVLCDHSKIGRTSLAQAGSIEQTHVVVSNRPLPKEYQQKLEEKGISIYTAPGETHLAASS